MGAKINKKELPNTAGNNYKALLVITGKPTWVSVDLTPHGACVFSAVYPDSLPVNLITKKAYGTYTHKSGVSTINFKINGVNSISDKTLTMYVGTASGTVTFPQETRDWTNPVLGSVDVSGGSDGTTYPIYLMCSGSGISLLGFVATIN